MRSDHPCHPSMPPLYTREKHRCRITISATGLLLQIIVRKLPLKKLPDFNWLRDGACLMATFSTTTKPPHRRDEMRYYCSTTAFEPNSGLAAEYLSANIESSVATVSHATVARICGRTEGWFVHSKRSTSALPTCCVEESDKSTACRRLLFWSSSSLPVLSTYSRTRLRIRQ